ncbi:MAG: histone deacetylase [Thermodesulfobacteriota bacterium]
MSALPKIGIIRDQRFLRHLTGLSHPESPERLSTIYRLLDYDFPDSFPQLPAEPATLQQIEAVHQPGYVQMVLATARRRFTHLAADTTASTDTCLAAWLAAGACVQGVEALLAGEMDICLTLVRPPGHHALPERAAGFCIFNNLGIAARYALGRGLQRILIVDWDLHHGNGLQELFYDQAEVFYFSSHHLPSFPRTGDWQETGRGAGLGYTLNLCLPAGFNDADILHLYRDALTPVVERYRPQLILVACGFDAHADDPLGNLALSAEGFAGLAALIMALGPQQSGVPVLLALEGGYNPTALADCLRRMLEAFTGVQTRAWSAHSDLAAELVERARDLHRPYRVWTD